MEKKPVFVNCSNHPSDRWGAFQMREAEKYGTVADVRFPAVDPSMTEEEIAELAEQTCREILSCDPETVMCQGEFTLTYAIVRRLREQGVRVVAACSRRMTKERTGSYGSKKEVYFRFEGFREYR
ncbi:MAG TPA: hypothetical protein H9852_05865 [Candidatus Mediterraneibacter colneyensis]|nr:hypothetical protein [Candidatus Mediterraneibacter colneyensis]